MKQKWKRTLAYLLTFVMLFGIMPDTSIVSYAEEKKVVLTEATDETTDTTTVEQEEILLENTEEVTDENEEEQSTTESSTEAIQLIESTVETSTEVETTTESSPEEVVSQKTITELSTEDVLPENTSSVEESTEEIEDSTIEQESTDTNEEISTIKTPLVPTIQIQKADNAKESSKKYTIYSDGTWDDGIIWYVNPKSKHYVFCLERGATMYNGQYEGTVTTGYSGKEAFKKSVALNYFYKTNGNSWSGKKNYGPVQEVIWDWSNSETAQKLTTYVNHAWKLTSLNENRKSGTSSYSSILKGINKSEQEDDSARATMISTLTNSNHIINLSDSFDATSASYVDTINLDGKAWKYFNNGGYDGGDSDIVVDGVYNTDGTLATDCSASINSDGNLSVNIKPTFTMGQDEASAYTVIMHISFDYKGSNEIDYLLTPSGKQNLTYDADFDSTAYFAVRVYAKSDSSPAKLYINKVDEYDTFISGCTFQLTGVQGDALTNGVNLIQTINRSSDYFRIEYPGYYKLVETAVPSSDIKLNTSENYIYAEYNSNSELLLYVAFLNSDGSFSINQSPSFGNGGGLGGFTSEHEGEGTLHLKYKFRNYYTSGSATLTKYANLLVKYENGEFVYENRTLDSVGFNFYAAEDIYLGETLIFSKDAEIFCGTQWGSRTGSVGNYEHAVMIDGSLVLHEAGYGMALSKYRGYTANGGKLTISDLPPGSYYCVESDLSHPGLVMAIGRYDFDVTGGNDTLINGSNGILNKMAPADIYVYKQDENTKEYLEGAEFTLYANINNTNYDGQRLFTEAQTVDAVVQRNLTTGEEVIERKTWIPIYVKTSNESGLAMFENLPYGDYLISETKAPDNYELPEKTFKFTHSLNGAEAANAHSGYVYQFNYGNIPTSDFEICKKAEKAYLNTATEKNVDAYVYKDEGIEGAVFGVYADAEIKNTLGEVVFKQGDLVKRCITDEDGIAQFGGAMFVGKYYFQEIQTADDSIYELDTTKHYFEVTGTEDVKNLTEEALINKQYKGSIKVIKTDGVTKVALSDVEFNLLDSSKEKVLGTYVTDANGALYIKNLPIGTYYIQEVKAKENYILDDTLREVTISKENLDHELSITNEEYKGSIKIIKTDGKTKVALSDVEFKLYDGTQINILGTYVTDEKGEILIDNLSVGTYYLQESKTKKGYKLDDKMVEVVISVGDLHKQVEFENYRTDTKITIKTDSTYSGSGQVRTGDTSPIGFIMLLFLLSSFCAAYFAKKKDARLKPLSIRTKKLMVLALVIASSTVVGGLTVKAAVDLTELSSKEIANAEYNGKVYTYALQKQYETSNQDSRIDFEEELDGMKLADVNYEIIETILQKETLEETKDYKDLIVKDESKIAETITKNGNVYDLQDVTWSEVPNMETVSYTVDYGYQTAEPTPEATYEYTYTSPVMKKDNTVILPFVRLEKGNEEWVDGFSATVTFHNLDGLYFTLGDDEFEYNPDKLFLSDSDYKELVKMLGYDTSKYRLNSIAWSGKEYKKNGKLCRDAKASGQQYATSYKAHYADEVQNGKIYTAHATYMCEVEVPAEEESPTYVMQATAYYEDEGGVWTNIITFITEHKGASAVVFGVLFLFIILVIVWLLKKRKPTYSSDETYTE